MALVASLANVVSSICQRLGVESVEATTGPSVGLVRRMVRRPVWVMGFGVMFLGYCAQAVALHLGSLNVVQPVLVTEWVFLVFVLWLWYGTPLRARDVLAALTTSAGLGLFLAVASPSAGHETPTNARWLVVGVVIVAVSGALVLVARRGPAWWRALVLGAAAAIGFALVAALTKSVTTLLLRGVGSLFGSWQLYALAVIGLTSFVIMQSAFQSGPFGASQSTLILLGPLLAIVVGHVLFGEHLRGGAMHEWLEVATLALMIAGGVGLATSPLVAGVHDEKPGAHLLEGRGLVARRRQEI